MHFAAEHRNLRNILRASSVSRIALMAFLSVSSVSAVVPQMASAQSWQFSNVRIEGNERIEPQTVLSYTGISQGQSVSAGELNDAYQRLAASGLFEKVELVPQGGTLVIRVQEYPTINVVNFEGNARLNDEALAKLVKSSSRRAYSPTQAEADAAAIAMGYQAQGRMAATVEPRIIRRDGNRVDLVFDIKEGKNTEIERISFVGNNAYSDRRLRQVLDSKQAGLFRMLVRADTFLPERLENDKQMLRDFYLARGYVDFQVTGSVGEMTRERDGFYVTFSVNEGRQFNFGNIKTVSEVEGVDAAEFAALVKMRSGTTYSPSVVETNIKRMENLALRKGLNFISFEPRITRNDRDQTLDITFAITRGPRVFVERIDIEGNTTTMDQVIRREFRSAEGDPFNPSEIRRAAERIRALGFFKEAAVDAQPGSAADQVVINVDVEEQPTGSLNFGVSYGADDGVGLEVGVSESNFLGRGQTIGVSIGTSEDNKQAYLSFVEPAFLGRDLAFSFGAGYTESNYSNAYYNTRVGSLSFGLGFPVGEYSRMGLSYKLEDRKIRKVSPDSSIILHREEAAGGDLTSAIGYSFSYDTRKGGLDPLGGVYLSFSQEYAGLGSDNRYIRTEAMALAERRVLNEEVLLRAVFEGGLLHATKGSTNVTERFFANGKIRGFESNGIGPRDLNAINRDALGGNAYAVARLESEFPVGLPQEYGIMGGLFFDVGSVWSLDNVNGGPANRSCPVASCVVDDRFHLRSSIGFSIFWDTPLGPLRFNISKALKKLDYDKERKFDMTIRSSF